MLSNGTSVFCLQQNVYGGGSLAVGHRQRAARVGFADLDRFGSRRTPVPFDYAQGSGLWPAAKNDDKLMRGDYCAARFGARIAGIARDRVIGKTESRGPE